MSDRLVNEALSLLRGWCDGLEVYRVRSASPYTDGALLCPACQVNHGRIGDLVLPLTTLCFATGEQRYLELAELSVDFQEKNMSTPDGGYFNDLGNRWIGTTAFSALAIGETLITFKSKLPDRLYTKWLAIFERLCEFCYRRFENFDPVINYRAAEAALMAMSFSVTGNKEHMRRALIRERFCREHFDADGLFFGECHPIGYLSPAGCRGIDMGYDLEESLPLLTHCAELLGDRDLKEFYKARLLDHMELLLPDGAIDNSFGTRHNKWTYWGSRTSDGIISALCLFPDDSVIYKAAERVLSLWRSCTHGGLLSLPMAHLAGEPTCLHHTFCHAKALAQLINRGMPDRDSSAVTLPREREYGTKLMQNGRLALLSYGDFRATVNAVDIVRYKGADNGGGTLGMLWHKDTGPIIASTTDIYVPSEPLNMQYPRSREEVSSMTLRTVSAGVSSVTDKDTLLLPLEGGVSARAEGREVDYLCDGNRFRISVDTNRPALLILPVISGDAEVTRQGKRIRIGDIISIECNLEPQVDTDKKYFHPVGGFIYTEIKYAVTDKAQICITVGGKEE